MTKRYQVRGTMNGQRVIRSDWDEFVIAILEASRNDWHDDDPHVHDAETGEEIRGDQIDAILFEIGRQRTEQFADWNPETWSVNARDLLVIATFAGFDAQEIARRAVLSTKGSAKINVRTIERILGEINAEDKAAAAIEDPETQNLPVPVRDDDPDDDPDPAPAPKIKIVKVRAAQDGATLTWKSGGSGHLAGTYRIDVDGRPTGYAVPRYGTIGGWDALDLDWNPIPGGSALNTRRDVIARIVRLAETEAEIRRPVPSIDGGRDGLG